MPIAILIVIVVALGASAGAQASNPGNFLYDWKTNVNEKIVSAVKVNGEAEASWQAHLADRRLAEAEELAAEGKLTSSIGAELESSFESHATAAMEQAARINEEKDADEKAGVLSGLEASLKAHEAVLVSLESNADSQAKAVISSLIEKVRARINSTSTARIKAQNSLSVSVEVEAAARGKMKAAQNKINEVKSFVERKKGSLSSQIKASVDMHISLAEDSFASGEAALVAGTYAQAFAKFDEAMQHAQEAKIIANSNKVLSGIINIKIETQSNSQATTSANTSTNAGGSVNTNTPGGGSVNTNTNTGSSGTNGSVNVGGETNVNVNY